MKSEQQTFQEKVKCDPKYSITESKCYISMGSLKQVDPDVIVAPKATLLQDTGCWCTSSHLCCIPVFGHRGRGEIVLLLECHCWEWERKWTWDLLQPTESPMAGGRLGAWPSSSIAWPPPAAAAPTAGVGGFTYQGDGPWRAVWRLLGGTGSYQKLLGLCQDPQECWLFWLCSPLVPPPLQGTVLYEHSQSACGPVGKVLCSEKDRNKTSKVLDFF